ncbi:MAG TPA: polysaccharide lyase family 1 protein [Polyangiaceae bacterium]|nr:polysaccharide lyase family 1 protein [Polyangiaceae bacterium]
MRDTVAPSAPSPTTEGPPPAVGLDGNADGTGSAPGGAGAGQPVPTDCVAAAPATGPIGYGAATTGGGDAPELVVATFEEAAAALAAYHDTFKAQGSGALVLRYTGHFDYAAITDVCAQHSKEPQTLDVKEMENVTILGAPGSSANFGVRINRAKNVIVRNMTMGLLPGGDGSDAITIEGNGENGDVEDVWIDHNELFSSTKDDCEGAGDTEFDGLVDIKKGARRITVSYNYLHDHQKTGLLGFSDDDDTERYVTFHHNRYENVVSRTPLQRFGYIHLFNNYYGSITGSGINVRMGGVALVESNFFEHVANPVTSRFSDVVGYWELRNNHVGEGITWTVEDDTLANADDWQSTGAFPQGEPSYPYAPDEAACVEQIVRASAGATL